MHRIITPHFAHIFDFSGNYLVLERENSTWLLQKVESVTKLAASQLQTPILSGQSHPEVDFLGTQKIV